MLTQQIIKIIAMKKYLIIFHTFIIIGLISCQSEDEKVTAKYVKNPISATGIDTSVELPAFEIISREEGTDASIYDFGVLLQGENVVHIFEIKNTGKVNLLIVSASAACGCTVPKFSREPILPGKTGRVEVAFSTSGRSGKQVKTIVLTTNAQPSTVTLTIIANVVVPI